MELYNLNEDLVIFGKQVKTFPAGIPEAFGELMKMIPDGRMRSYFGISYIKENKIFYFAMALEVHDGEAEKYNGERYIIEKGEYLTVTVTDWMKKTACIKDVFHEMMQDNRADNCNPCVEWYKNDNEMICILKTKLAEATSPFIKPGIVGAKE